MVHHLQLDKNYHLRRIKVKIDLVTILNAFLSTEKKQTHTHASAVCACHSFHTSMQRFRVVNESRMCGPDLWSEKGVDFQLSDQIRL